MPAVAAHLFVGEVGRILLVGQGEAGVLALDRDLLDVPRVAVEGSALPLPNHLPASKQTDKDTQNNTTTGRTTGAR